MKRYTILSVLLLLTILTACGTSAGGSLGVGAAGTAAAEPQSSPAVSTPDDLAAPAVQETEYIVLSSEKADARLSVPAEYADEVTVDTPVTYTSPITDEVFYFDTTMFAFRDAGQEPGRINGLVWGIGVFPMELWEDVLQNNREWGNSVAEVNSHILGHRDDSIYFVVFLRGDAADPVNFPGDQAHYAAVESYYRHMEAGMAMLEDFVSQNDLETDAAIDWKQWYESNLLAPVQKYLSELPG